MVPIQFHASVFFCKNRVESSDSDEHEVGVGVDATCLSEACAARCHHHGGRGSRATRRREDEEAKETKGRTHHSPDQIDDQVQRHWALPFGNSPPPPPAPSPTIVFALSSHWHSCTKLILMRCIDAVWFDKMLTEELQLTPETLMAISFMFSGASHVVSC